MSEVEEQGTATTKTVASRCRQEGPDTRSARTNPA